MFTNNSEGKHWPHNVACPVKVAELLDKKEMN